MGLPETTVKESWIEEKRDYQLTLEFPAKRITVNLSQQIYPKRVGDSTLPIALGILAASEQILVEGLSSREFVGELALSASCVMVGFTGSVSRPKR